MPDTDFITLARSGAQLQTRDRRAVRLIAIDEAADILRGSIAMEGELTWRRDGGLTGTAAGSDGGVAGPLDLAPPSQAAAQGTSRRASLRDALNDGAAADRAPFCCD